MKISMAGAEVLVLEKMVLDEKVPLVEHYEVEWLDRTNPRFRGERIYVQLMFDSYGFDCTYYTILADARKAFQNNETWDSVPKLRDWRPLPEIDTFAHYIQRPVVHGPVIQPRRELKNL